MNPKISTTITRKISFTVSKSQLLHYLTNTEACGMIIPPHAKVWTRVPGGGDWSYESLDIDEIFIEWEEIERK